tara:strand:+ start:14 stop:580 length:567 start_codon:yes stop_codon:yes gene_type:complete
MAVVINGNGTVTGLTALPSSAMATGSVVQVQSVTMADKFQVDANSTPQDVTGLTVNITPTSSSNKILIIVHVNATAGSSYAGSGFTLVRVDSGSATDIFKGNASGSTSRFTLPASGTNSDTGANNGYPDTHCGSFLDSPSSTNQLTYKIQVADYDNTNTIYVNGQDNTATTTSATRNTSGITLMEIVA